MNISSVNSSYAGTSVTSENIKQSTQSDKQAEALAKVTDTVTISPEAEEALRSQKEAQENSGSAVTAEPSAAASTGGKMPAGTPKAANNAGESQSTSTEVKTVAAGTTASAEKTTAQQTSELVSESTSSSSSSKYTAAEIAEYDLNNDGEIDASEEALMLQAKAREAREAEADKSADQASEQASFENSLTQIKSKEAYETAKWQLQASPATASQFSLQV